MDTNEIIKLFPQIGIEKIGIEILDIALIAFIFYKLLTLIKGTRAMEIFKGLLILIGGAILAQLMGLPTLTWLLKSFWMLWVMALIIVFQPELRTALSHLGSKRFFWGILTTFKNEFVDDIIGIIAIFSQKKIGSLIIIERETGLKDFIETGVKLNGEISYELLGTIFSTQSPLHDGAVVIQNNKVTAAACRLPISKNPRLPKSTGMRHRAALGLAEITDAVILVTSEETGKISLATEGKLIQEVELEDLREMILNLCCKALEKKVEDWRWKMHIPKEKLTAHWKMKLLSLALAVLIWFYVKKLL